MSESLKQSKNIFPDNVAIIGGGRWARVLIEVLCDLVPKSVKLSVHSPRNANAMATWVSNRDWEKRISVSSSLPAYSSAISNAVIVVNTARDHEKTVEWAIAQGYPVLVEKPLCLNYIPAQRLVNLALIQNNYLATAHVFLFARYIESFSKLVTDQKGIVSISVRWGDPQSENRYGENKRYDPGLPIYADWLPHILSILGTFAIGIAWSCERVDFQKGGAALKLRLTDGEITCEIVLIRNGSSRQRTFEVITRRKKITLDFACEPGFIYADGEATSGASDWENEPKPVAKMLTAFLQGVSSGIRDSRLDSSIGLNALQVIDQTAFLYNAALFPWVSNQLSTHRGEINDDLRYALCEILQIYDPISVLSVQERVDNIFRSIKKNTEKINSNQKVFGVDIIALVIQLGNAA